MIETYLRNQYQKVLVNPIATRLKHTITPNQVTILSGLIGIMILPALWLGQNTLGILLLLLSGYLDTLDGTLARETNRSSDWGTVLDIMVDRLVEFMVIFALWSISPATRSFWCMLMLGSILICVTSFLVVGIFSANTSEKGFYYSPGIMERAEAFIFFIAMIIWPYLFEPFALLFTSLVLLTAIIRLFQFYRQAHNASKNKYH